jgi:hypothetical protein
VFEKSAKRDILLSANRFDLRIILCELAPPGDGKAAREADNHGMKMQMLGRLRGGIDPLDLRRVERCCSHALVPGEPAAAGYRYHDLGGELPPFYLRRFRYAADRCATVSLIGPVELSSGADAERGAPAVALVQVSVGACLVPWHDVADMPDDPELSPLLARAALEAVFELQLLERDECPFCE